MLFEPAIPIIWTTSSIARIGEIRPYLEQPAVTANSLPQPSLKTIATWSDQGTSPPNSVSGSASSYVASNVPVIDIYRIPIPRREDDLRAQMSKLSLQLANLTARIKDLESVFDQSKSESEEYRSLELGFDASSESLEEIVRVLGVDSCGDSWAAALDAIAEGNAPPIALGEKIVEIGLRSPDPAVRSAAVGAFVQISPSKAQRVLGDHFTSEKNRVVKSMIESALRTIAV